MSEFIPNTFQTPNAIIDTLMPLLTDGEFRVLMYTVRNILGWQKKAPTRRARISLSNFENGYSYETPDGIVTYAGCGVKLPAIRNALKELQKYRILKAIGNPTQQGQEWELAFMTDDNVDIAGLKLRQDNKLRRARKQTAKARQKSPNNQGGVLLNSHTSGGTVEQIGRGTVEQIGGGTVEQSTTKEHSKDHSKDQTTIPHAVKSPVQDDELQAMEEAVKVELKQYNKAQRRNVARSLLLRHGDTDKDIKQKITPAQLKEFGAWWDATKRKDDKPLTRPKNMNSIKTWIDEWLDTQAQREQEAVATKRKHDNRKLPINLEMLATRESA